MARSMAEAQPMRTITASSPGELQPPRDVLAVGDPAGAQDHLAGHPVEVDLAASPVKLSATRKRPPRT